MLEKRPEVSILIKALNEECRIAAAIESSIAALADMPGEIILADSASTDRTVEIAAHYPIKIVRLSRLAERSCGAGVQLGYQYSAGEYVCLIDGDMQLHPRFLSVAVEFLKEHPDFAGVGGMIVERETGNFEYAKRASAVDFDRLPGEVTRLDCGGVYRREAIASVGYLGDRNLHGREELELGVRLRALGWRLARIPVTAIDHHGHAGNAYTLLWRRWVTGFAFSTGEILRATFAQNDFKLALHKLRRELFLFASVHFWWLCLLAAPLAAGGVAAAGIALAIISSIPFLAMSARCRSIGIGVYSVVAWNVYAAGLWPGLFRRRLDPAGWIESTVVQGAIGSDSRVAAA